VLRPWKQLRKAHADGSGKLRLRVPPEIHGKALVKAQAPGKSQDQWATEALERAVDAEG
jgi:predicted HicB family RNase H-like nuclease